MNNQNIGTLHTNICIGALSTFKMLAGSRWTCSESISVLSGPSGDVIQVDELNAIGINVVVLDYATI